MVSYIFEIIDDIIIEPRLNVSQRLHGGVHDGKGADTHQQVSPSTENHTANAYSLAAGWIESFEYIKFHLQVCRDHD
jgi:hypothetical protein